MGIMARAATAALKVGVRDAGWWYLTLALPATGDCAFAPDQNRLSSEGEVERIPGAGQDVRKSGGRPLTRSPG